MSKPIGIASWLLIAAGLLAVALGLGIAIGALAGVPLPRFGRTVVDGPFAETKELIAGYTIIKVKTRAEAVEWTRKFPNPTLEGTDCEIEVRQMFELEDFGEDEVLDRFREMGISGAEKGKRP